MKEITAEGIRETCDALTAAARAFPSLYVSVDIDVVDPAFAPGTGYAEPGGLTASEILYVIERVAKLSNRVACDIVEVNPRLDTTHITSKMAARILTTLATAAPHQA